MNKITHLVKKARKFRRRIAAFALIILVIGAPIITYLLANVGRANASWWNGDWAYRKAINISAHTGAESNVLDSRLPNEVLEKVTIQNLVNLNGSDTTRVEAVKIHFGAACKERAIDFLDQILIRIIKRETSHANKMVQDRSSISLV